MRSTAPKSSLLVALGVATLGAGCLKLNPAFDGQGALTDSGSSGETSGSGGPTTGSTGAAPTTGVPTTGGTTTGEPTTGGLDPGSTGMSSETGATTDGPSDCWDQPLDDFVLSVLVPGANGSGSPSLSPDGLSLFFKAPVALPDKFEVRRLSRLAPADDFIGPAEVFFGPSDTDKLDYPEVVAGNSKIFFTQDGGEIYSARFENGMWTTWGVAGTTAAFSPNDIESHPNATENGAILLYQRDDGPGVGSLRTTFRFWQAALDVDNDSFNTPPVEVTPQHADLLIPLCPAMSPDGLHLLFAAKDAAGDLEQFNDGSVGVWSTHRAATSAPWDPPVRSSVRENGSITCPTSITADGCQATFIRFTLPASNYTMYLGRRG